LSGVYPADDLAGWEGCPFFEAEFEDAAVGLSTDNQLVGFEIAVSVGFGAVFLTGIYKNG
jgi:hypothetical protein